MSPNEPLQPTGAAVAPCPGTIRHVAVRSSVISVGQKATSRQKSSNGVQSPRLIRKAKPTDSCKSCITSTYEHVRSPFSGSNTTRRCRTWGPTSRMMNVAFFPEFPGLIWSEPAPQAVVCQLTDYRASSTSKCLAAFPMATSS